MARRMRSHALLALLMLLVQLGALQQLTTIPPDVAAQLSLSLPLELVLTLAWALIFAWLAVNLWRGSPTRWLWRAMLVYAAIGLARLLLFARADYDRGRLPILLFALLPPALLLLQRRLRGRRKPET